MALSNSEVPKTSGQNEQAEVFSDDDQEAMVMTQKNRMKKPK